MPDRGYAVCIDRGGDEAIKTLTVAGFLWTAQRHSRRWPARFRCRREPVLFLFAANLVVRPKRWQADSPRESPSTLMDASLLVFIARIRVEPAPAPSLSSGPAWAACPHARA